MMKKWIKRIDVGHLLLVLFIAGSVSWYFFDAYTASSNIQNIILIAPASLLAIVLCLVILYQIFTAQTEKTASRQMLASQHNASTSKDAFRKPVQCLLTRMGRYRIFAFIIAFGLYVGLLERIGFDIATYLFIGTIMALQGERHIGIIVAYSLVFGTLAVWPCPFSSCLGRIPQVLI